MIVSAPIEVTNLTIDLSALGHNYRVLQKASGWAKVAPVVKANAYGLGAGPVSRRLYEEGARKFFVARVSEGEALRLELPEADAEILVLDGCPAGRADRLREARLTPVLSSLAQAVEWGAAPAPLHIDTGMNRLGLSLEDAAVLARQGFEPTLLMSHLGSGEDPANPRNAEQLARFTEARARFPDVPASLAASSGIYLGPDYHFHVTRPGISLYGGGPREVPHPDFRAVATMDAPVLQVRDLKPGERAGYGTMFEVPRAMQLALVGAGYADGIIRRSHGGGYACINGRKARFCIVTMDLIGIDVSDTPVKVGDRAELLGANALLDDLAHAAGSVAHECLVRLSGRAARTYLG